MSYAGTALQLAGDATVSFTPLEQAPACASVRELQLDGKAFGYIRVDEFPFQSYSGLALEVADLGDLPAALGEALDDGMSRVVLAAFPQSLTARLRLGPALGMVALQSRAEAPALQWFSCVLHGPADEPICFTFAATPDTICAQLAGDPPTAQRAHPALRHLLTSRAHRLLGTASLLLPEINGLAAGDFILFSPACAEGERAVLVDQQILTFTAEEPGWACVDRRPVDGLSAQAPAAVTQEDALLTLPDQDQAAVGQTMAPAQLALTVSFCLGATQVPLSEIEHWQTGAVVELPDAISAEEVQVTVTANGTALAQGDLVRIDDRLAVRLTRVLLASPAAQG